jgi:diacylglycerol kinase (ATP)
MNRSAARMLFVSLPRDPPRHAPQRDWVKNFFYASRGIAYAWRTERNFRLEVMLGALAVIVALLLRADVVPILLCCALVLSLELINTALEAVVDLVSPTYHPLARITKDVAAGAVLMASAISAVVGATVLLPALWRQFG